jgi:hypothetical protein
VHLNGVMGRRLSLTVRVAYRFFCHPAEKVVVARRQAELDAVVRQDDVDLAEHNCQAASKWELIAQIAVQWLPRSVSNILIRNDVLSSNTQGGSRVR